MTLGRHVDVLLEGAAVIDGAGCAHAPGALLLRLDRPNGLRIDGDGSNTDVEAWSNVILLAVGAPADVRSHPAATAARRIDLSGMVLLPGLVNAHTHLDLTHIGPKRHDPACGFVGFAKIVVPNRRTDEPGVRESVREGVRLSLAGGTVAVGDIAGYVPNAGGLVAWPRNEVRASPLMGVSYLEYFGVSNAAADRLPRVMQALTDEFTAACRRCIAISQTVEGQAVDISRHWQRGERVRTGLSPHAPYSVGEVGYGMAIGMSRAMHLPVMTHLAESMQERRALVRGDGEIIEWLRSMGLWDEGAAGWFGKSGSSVERIRTTLDAGLGEMLSVVHCNDVSDADAVLLRQSRVCVAYCPRSSAYFGHERDFGPHRYRYLMRSGITVALGTDSVINLPEGARSGEVRGDRLSVLDEMRFLFRRDGGGEGGATALLKMGTANGARLLGLDEPAFTFGRVGGPVAGVVGVPIGGRASDAVDALERALGAGNDAGPVLAVMGSAG